MINRLSFGVNSINLNCSGNETKYGKIYDLMYEKIPRLLKRLVHHVISPFGEISSKTDLKIAIVHNLKL